DASWNTLWSTNTGGGSLAYNFNGWGGNLQLLGSELQVLAPSGEPTWSGTTCAGSDSWACQSTALNETSDVYSSARTYGVVNWVSSGAIILSSADAEVKWTKASYVGTVSLVDQTSIVLSSGVGATTIWSESNSFPSAATGMASLNVNTTYGFSSG